MSLRAILLSLLILSQPALAAPRIMSINLCADTLLLDLLPPAQITSLTTLARDPTLSPHWRQAASIPTNAGTAEEVLAQHPTLVIAGRWTTPATRAVLRRLRWPMLELPSATSFAEIRAITTQLAQAVNQPARGAALIAHMNATLAQLAQSGPATPIPVLVWNGSTAPPAPDPLFDAVLAAAGARQTAIPARDLEQVLAAGPAVLLQGDSALASPSRQRQIARHPALAAFAGRILRYPDGRTSCGIPELADEARTLRAAFRAPGATRR